MTAQPFNGSDILPAAATALQRILADYQWSRSAALDPDVIRRVVDPDLCPVELLDWLAFAKSVDAWDRDWSEARKRAVIRASPEVHRIKGTRKAVRLALEALGVSSRIREWWEAGAEGERRASFKVILDALGGGATLDRPMMRQVRIQVRGAKPKSRIFGLAVEAGLTGPVNVGGCTYTRVGRTLRNLRTTDGTALGRAGGTLSVTHRMTINPPA